MATARSTEFAQFVNDQNPFTAIMLAIADHQAGAFIDAQFVKQLREAANIVANNDKTLRTLEHAFIEMGKQGANADLNHPLRSAWHYAREVLREAGRVK
jgi:hypothetical protein